MKLDELVCSFGCAQVLMGFGIKQESLFYWWTHLEKDKSPSIVYTKGKIIDKDYCSAFTVGELLAMIPHRITLKNNEPFNSFTFRMKKSIYLPQQVSMDHMADALHCMVNMREMYIVNYECDSTECAGEDAWMTRTLINNIHDENPANALAKLIVTLIQDKLFVADVNK